MSITAFPEKFRRIPVQTGVQLFDTAFVKTVLRIKRARCRNPGQDIVLSGTDHSLRVTRGPDMFLRTFQQFRTDPASTAGFVHTEQINRIFMHNRRTDQTSVSVSFFKNFVFRTAEDFQNLSLLPHNKRKISPENRIQLRHNFSPFAQ